MKPEGQGLPDLCFFQRNLKSEYLCSISSWRLKFFQRSLWAKTNIYKLNLPTRQQRLQPQTEVLSPCFRAFAQVFPAASTVPLPLPLPASRYCIHPPGIYPIATASRESSLICKVWLGSLVISSPTFLCLSITAHSRACNYMFGGRGWIYLIRFLLHHGARGPSQGRHW